MDELSLEELEKQLVELNQILQSEPDNAEYESMAKELREAIQLSKELASSNIRIDGFDDSNPTISVGTKVQAIWSEDGEWYNGTVRAVTPNGFLVVYDEWGNQEEVDASNVRLLNAEREAEATRQAIKRKIAQAADVDVVPKELPLKLKIKPDDPEDVRLAKKKKIHAFKSKVRFEQMEVAQNKRQNAWQQFQTNKGKSKKVGFFTGRKKESIFKSPDDPRGRVGVTGSGKGITEFQKREKHLHSKEGGGEVEEPVHG